MEGKKRSQSFNKKIDKGVFKNILSEFSRFPHIKNLGELYPVPREEILPEEQFSYLQVRKNELFLPPANPIKKKEEKQKNNNNLYLTELFPESPQNKEKAKAEQEDEKLQELKDKRFRLLKRIDPKQFLDIKNQFSNYKQQGGVNIDHFVAIMCEVLCYAQEYSPQLDDKIKLFIEIYRLVDFQNNEKITFDKFSNFIIMLQEILARDTRLYEVKIKKVVQENLIDHFPIEKLFPLQGLNCFALLEQSLKFLKLIDAQKMATIENINLGSSTINAAGYIKSREVIIISSNDKFLNFFDVVEKQLLRRFQVPSIQLHIEMCPEKNIFYTSNSTGTIYSWSIDKIFEPSFDQQVIDSKELYKQALFEKPLTEQYDVTVMKNCEELGSLLTGSNDTVVRMYENKRKFTGQVQHFRGHIKGIKGIDFCQEMKYIISCSYEFDIFVWNAYLDHPVIKLSGHEAPIVNVICPAQVGEVILSGDSKGIIKLWNARNFQLLQTVNTSDGTPGYRLKGLIYRKRYKRLVLGAKKVFFYDFQDSFDPELTDDKNMFTMIFSRVHLEVITASGRTIKVWCMRRGILIRIFKDVVSSDITCLSLDTIERKLFVSTHKGELLCLDILTGIIIQQLHDHAKQVSFLSYCRDSNLLITGSWDRSIQIHNDCRKDVSQQKRDIFRSIQNAYQSDLMGGACSENQLLIATIGRESDIRLWDLEKAMFVEKLSCEPGSQFVNVVFLDPLPMLIASDVTGNIYIWATRPHRYQNKLLVKWQNFDEQGIHAQVTAITYEFVESVNRLLIVIGDEKGFLKIFDASQILVDCQIMKATSRIQHTNLYRIKDYVFSQDELQYISQQQAPPLIFSDKNIQLLNECQAHPQSAINTLIIINETVRTCILSLGKDRKVQLWSLDTIQELGMLQQGTEVNSSWNFNLKQSYNLDFVENTFQKVQKQLNKIIIRRKQIRWDMIVPFQKDDDPDYQRALLDRVESHEVLQVIKEVDLYLEKQQRENNNNQSFSYSSHRV